MDDNGNGLLIKEREADPRKILFTQKFLEFVGYDSKKKEVRDKRLLRLIRILKWFGISLLTQAILIPIFYIAFYFSKHKVLPIIVFTTSILPFIFSIIFISLFSKLKKGFGIQQQSNNNSQIVEPDIFNKGYKYYILFIGTSFGYFLGLVVLAGLNLTKSIEHNNILNIILPIVLVIFTIVVTSLIQNFGWFLDEVSRVGLDRVENNNGIYTYSTRIKVHEWSRVKAIPVVGNKLVQFFEMCRRRWNYKDFELLDACNSLLDAPTPTNRM